MSKEMLPELNTGGDLMFKIGIVSVVVIIIYFLFNLFSKLREINEKLDSFLVDLNPVETQEPPNAPIEDITEQPENKVSNVDLTGVDKDLTTIEE